MAMRPPTARRLRTVLVTAILMAAGGAPLAAQQADTTAHVPWYQPVSHWAKWPALAGAVGFTTLAILRHDDADRVFNGLLDYCRAASDQCRLNAQGTYVSSDAEALYQETLRIDRQARAWMLAGQVALAASGGMFLIDLISGHHGPNNIPFSPIQASATPGRLTFRIPF